MPPTPLPTETVAPALRPPPGNPRFPLMDGLRAVAALTVLVYHVGYFGGVQARHSWGFLLTSGGFGVSIFFVLSGFLLYRPFVAAAHGLAPRTRLRDYARRRALRVLPAYWLALTVLAIFPGLPGVFTGTWWRYYGLLQAYASTTLVRASGIPVAWSLCIEVSFYVALPLLSLALIRLEAGRGLRRQLIGLAVLAVLSLLGGWVRLGDATPPLLLTFFDWFAFGMGLAVVSVSLQGRERLPRPAEFVAAHPGACWGAAAAVYLGLSLIVRDAPQHAVLSHLQSVADHVLRGVVAFLVVLPAVFGDRRGGWPRALLGARVVRWLGLISYGIFLWHLPLLEWLHSHGVSSPLALLVLTLSWTIACASASYYLVERPLLRFKYRGSGARPSARRTAPARGAARA